MCSTFGARKGPKKPSNLVVKSHCDAAEANRATSRPVSTFLVNVNGTFRIGGRAAGSRPVGYIHGAFGNGT